MPPIRRRPTPNRRSFLGLMGATTAVAVSPSLLTGCSSGGGGGGSASDSGVLDDLIPGWWDEAPVQRWVTRRATVLMTDHQALTVDYRTSTWGSPPYNGATAYRPDFDQWLAGKAVEAGAVLVTSTTAVGLLVDEATGQVCGVRTDRPDGDLTARVVVACMMRIADCITCSYSPTLPPK